MTKASDNLFPGIILRESADDGSDFSNPSADYRRLFLGEDGDLHLKDSSGTVTDIGGGSGGTVVAGVTRLTSGDLTGLNSTSFADLTGVTVTITTEARRCLVTATLVWVMTATGSPGTACFDLAVDGTRVGQTFGLHAEDFANSDAMARTVSFTVITDSLTAASHTFKIQYRVTVGTMTVYASTSVTPAVISVVELAT